jgi:hypothetical protein
LQRITHNAAVGSFLGKIKVNFALTITVWPPLTLFLVSGTFEIVDRLRNLPIVEVTSGLALLEFAFTAPAMLLIGLTGMETANLAVAHLQVSQIAMLVEDNASRVRSSIDEADIREIFNGAHLTGKAIDFSPNACIILSYLE